MRNNICTHRTHAQCGVSWCWGIHYWFPFVLLCGYCSVSLLSLASHLHQRPPLYNSHFFWRTVHTFTLVSTSLQRPLFFCPQGGCCREVQLYIKLLVIANVHNTKKLPLSFQMNINGILIGADSYASVLLAHCTIECLYGKLFITIQCHTGC